MTNADPLPVRQAAVVAILVEYRETGRPCPTQGEIGGVLNITRQAVAKLLARLRRRGIVDYDDAAHRAIQVVAERQPPQKSESMPIM